MAARPRVLRRPPGGAETEGYILRRPSGVSGSGALLRQANSRTGAIRAEADPRDPLGGHHETRWDVRVDLSWVALLRSVRWTLGRRRDARGPVSRLSRDPAATAAGVPVDPSRENGPKARPSFALLTRPVCFHTVRADVGLRPEAYGQTAGNRRRTVRINATRHSPGWQGPGTRRHSPRPTGPRGWRAGAYRRRAAASDGTAPVNADLARQEPEARRKVRCGTGAGECLANGGRSPVDGGQVSCGQLLCRSRGFIVARRRYSWFIPTSVACSALTASCRDLSDALFQQVSRPCRSTTPWPAPPHLVPSLLGP